MIGLSVLHIIYLLISKCKTLIIVEKQLILVGFQFNVSGTLGLRIRNKRISLSIM